MRSTESFTLGTAYTYNVAHSLLEDNTTEFTERWPCPLFNILLDKSFLLASLVACRRLQCTASTD
jgi:hypothetical protein